MNIITRLTHNLKTRMAAAALLFASLSAQAHPGHTLHEENTLHYVTSPYHIIVVALMGLLLCGAAYMVKQPAMRRILAAGGAAALFIAAILFQMPS